MRSDEETIAAFKEWLKASAQGQLFYNSWCYCCASRTHCGGHIRWVDWESDAAGVWPDRVPRVDIMT